METIELISFSILMSISFIVGAYTVIYIGQIKKQRGQFGIVIPLFLERVIIASAFLAFFITILIGIVFLISFID